MKALFLVFLTVVIIPTSFLFVFADSLDLPVMHKNHITKECIKVVTKDGDKPCDYIKQGDKYRVIWVIAF